jgi:excisionase family DNA binding protein
VDEEQTLSIAKACEVVGVSRRTIYNWIAGGRVGMCTAGSSVHLCGFLWHAPQPTQSEQIQHWPSIDRRSRYPPSRDTMNRLS